MSTSQSTSADVQSQCDQMVALWLKNVERVKFASIADEDLQSHAAAVIETIRECREFARSLSPEFRPARALGDIIGHDSLKRTLGRLFKIEKDITLGKVRQGYRTYLKEKGAL